MEKHDGRGDQAAEECEPIGKFFDSPGGEGGVFKAGLVVGGGGGLFAIGFVFLFHALAFYGGESWPVRSGYPDARRGWRIRRLGRVRGF